MTVTPQIASKPASGPWLIVEKLSAALAAQADAFELLIRQPVRMQLVDSEGRVIMLLSMLNDGTTATAIEAINIAGQTVAFPTGDTETVFGDTNDIATWSIGTLSDGVTPALIATPNPGATGTGTVTVKDSSGLPQLSVPYQFTADTNAVGLMLNLSEQQFTPFAQGVAQTAAKTPAPAPAAAGAKKA